MCALAWYLQARLDKRPMHDERGVLRIRRSMRLWSLCMSTLAWMSTRTGHKPVGYSHNVGFRYHREPEFLIEMNVCSSVGLEIRNCSIGIHMHTERGQQGASNSLALDGGFDGHWSQMPVRPRRIAMGPCRSEE